MDWEAPIDGWYVFLAVSLVSIAVAGVVLGLPTGPPPDAPEAANAIEPVAASDSESGSSWEYDAETIVIDGSTLELANDHGTSRASVDYDAIVVPVSGSDRLENITHGVAFEDEYEAELTDSDTHAVSEFLADVDDRYNENSGTELTASGELVTRQINVDPDSDSLDPLVETVELDTTTSEYGVGSASITGIGTVTASYDGVAGNELELDVDGEYVWLDGTSISDASTSELIPGRTGTLDVDIESSNINRPGSEPVDAMIEFDDGETCERELGFDTTETCTNSIPRTAEFDDDEPFVDYNTETDHYHVTLVSV